MYVRLRELQNEWGRHNHNVNRTLDMQMYVLSMDELNEVSVSVRGRNRQVPSEPQMYVAGRTGGRNNKKRHESYFKNGTFE